MHMFVGYSMALMYNSKVIRGPHDDNDDDDVDEHSFVCVYLCARV